MNKKTVKKIVLGATLSLISAGQTQAATINPTELTGDINYVSSISTYNTTGYTMDGMAVTVNFSSGFSETVYWDFTGNGKGAVGTGWELSMNDPSKSTYYGSYWQLFNTTSGDSISSIFIDGFDYNVVFDDENFVSRGTTGSGWGNILEIDNANEPTTTYNGIIDVLYKDAVAISGTPAYGDVYSSLTITFSGEEGFMSGDVFAFFQDTDNIEYPIPEPATMLLFGVGLSGLAGFRLSRKKR